MDDKLPPELTEKLRRLAEFHRSAPSPDAILICVEEAYPLIAEQAEAKLREAEKDAKRLDWAETHPVEAMQAFDMAWSDCGPGFREIRFEFRNIIDAALAAQEEKKKHK